MSLMEILRNDYDRFPKNQTYEIYADDVFFKDPLNEFRGIEKYKKTIAFIEKWFVEPKLVLHHIEAGEHGITTQWTLSWIAPLPWQPKMSIEGWSDLRVNDDRQICSHVDYWHCSRFDVFKQLFQR